MRARPRGPPRRGALAGIGALPVVVGRGRPAGAAEEDGPAPKAVVGLLLKDRPAAAETRERLHGLAAVGPWRHGL